MRDIQLKTYAIGLLTLLISACKDDATQALAQATVIDDTLLALVERRGQQETLTAPRNLPSIDSPKAQLGMQLFFSKALGGDSDSACVTCHHPMLGGGDNLALSIGVGAENPDLLGAGRAHSSSAQHFNDDPTVPRNAPTTFNMAFWDRALFHDGRVESLKGTAGQNGADGAIRTPDSPFGSADPQAGANLSIAQARFPVTSPEEMRGFVTEAGNSNNAIRNRLADKLALRNNDLDASTWLQAFQIGFQQADGSAGQLITYANIADAIASYENSQVFIRSPWRQYIEGDKTAIDDNAKQGALLFFNSVENGGADCVACHRGGFFTDEDFHVIAMPQIGRGKGDGMNGSDDFGRQRETGADDDRYAFRTPTLLNIEVTRPYGHAGAYNTLDSVIRHHLDPESALVNYDYSQLDANIPTRDLISNGELAVAQLKRLQQASKSRLPSNANLNEAQIESLVSFLFSLTDPCVKDRSCLAKWIPSANSPDPDGLRLNAHDMNDELL